MPNYINAFDLGPSLGTLVDQRNNLNANTAGRNLLNQQIQQEMATRSTLAELMPRYAQGDTSVLPQIAGADPNAYMSLSKHQAGIDELQRKAEMEKQAQFGRMAVWANDPQKWQSTPFAQQGIPFEQRDAVIGQFVGQGDVFDAVNPKVPESIQKLNYLMENPQAMAAEQSLRRSSASNTQVNVGPTGIDYGKPEQGLVWARNQDGTVKLDERGAPIAVPYQGGSVYRETKDAESAAGQRQAERGKYADIVTEDIDRVIGMVQDSTLPTTGLVGSVTQNIPGTSAHNIQQLAQGIRANITFDKLQAMREASPTGGALGQVSNFENQLMASTLGSLEQSQSKEQFLHNLKRVRRVYEQIIHRGIKPGDPISDDVSGGGSGGWSIRQVP